MQGFLKGAAVGGISAAVVFGAASALAGTGVDGIFNLGRTNTVDAKSVLKGATATKNLQITNTGAGSALGLRVRPDRPPMVVNSSVKVRKLNADKLDGLTSDRLQRAYKRTLVVSTRATPATGGNALRAAVAGISGASASNRFLIKIEPGNYDVGSAPLQMKSFVDIEGSGIGTTTITRSGGADWFDGTVAGATNSELRLLTVENTGGGTQAVAIVAQDINPFQCAGLRQRRPGRRIT
jgi:hypothetical protein